MEENVVYDYGPEKPKNTEIPAKPACSAEEDHILGGFILIGLGLYFLLNAFNLLGDISIVWWHLFILIPGLGLLAQAFVTFVRRGRLEKDAREHAFAGVMVVFVAAMFIFDLDWGRWWPFFLIIPGVAMLIGWIDD